MLYKHVQSSGMTLEHIARRPDGVIFAVRARWDRRRSHSVVSLQRPAAIRLHALCMTREDVLMRDMVVWDAADAAGGVCVPAVFTLAAVPHRL